MVARAGVATGKSEICRHGTTVLHLQVFWALPTYHLVMAEQRRLYFEMQAEGDQYIDLAACLTTANRKQYHQVKKDGTPICYSFTISSVGVNNVKTGKVATVANSWTTRNAVKMAAIGWKKQLSHAGVRIRDLPTYGKRPRFAYEPNGSKEYTLASGKKVQGLDLNLEPQNASAASLFTSYTDTAGDTITFNNANTITTVSVNDGTGTISEEIMCLRKPGAGDFGVIDEYLDARRNQDTLDEDTPGPSDDNKMTSLFSVAEEMSDDIIAAVEDYADNRPYNITDAGDEHLVGEFGTIATSGISTAALPQSISGEAPLGLLHVTGFDHSNQDTFMIDVHAVYEM